jgi:hypothetical protein
MKPFIVDQVEIPFDKNWKKVAISISGGADSALLTFLLCDKIINNTEIHFITHVRMWKTRPWQSWYSDRVIEWFKDRFPSIKFEKHVNFISPELEYGSVGPTIIDEYGKLVSGDNIEKRAFAEYICFINNIDSHYNAVTRNPRGINLGGMNERDIEQSSDNRHLTITKHMNRWACHPFRFVDKSWILKQYKNLNILDLFELTRSCEGEFKDIDYKSYIPGQHVPICNNCFWCRERSWAIDQLDN